MPVTTNDGENTYDGEENTYSAFSRVSIYIFSSEEVWRREEKGLILNQSQSTHSTPGFLHTIHYPHIVFHTLNLFSTFNMRLKAIYQHYTKR